jgi:hypothetical protein
MMHIKGNLFFSEFYKYTMDVIQIIHFVGVVSSLSKFSSVFSHLHLNFKLTERCKNSKKMNGLHARIE